MHCILFLSCSLEAFSVRVKCFLYHSSLSFIKKKLWHQSKIEHHIQIRFAAHHEDFLVAFVDRLVIHHADNGHTQVAPNAKRDAKSQAGQDCDDVAPRQAKAGAVHHWKLLLLHQLGTALG